MTGFQVGHIIRRYMSSKVCTGLFTEKRFMKESIKLSVCKIISAPYSSKSDGSKDLVIVEQLNTVRLIGINRPHKRNCINSETADALLQAFKDFDADTNSRVAVLYGKGGTFCAGYDLSEVASGSAKLPELNERGPMGPTHYETSKPVVGAIDGYAVAGGMELALWCDIRIMEETAVMGVFCRRFGVPLIDGGTVRLPAIVGLGRALDIILTGRPVSAQEALEIGLINQKVTPGCVLERAIFYAESLVNYPQAAFKADRNSARRAFSATSVYEALVQEHQRGLAALEEAKIGASQFVGGKGRHGTFQVPLEAFEKEPSN